MTRKEVGELLNRIKSHYSTFKVDDYKMNDWLAQLKQYASEDVHKNFERHLKSEIYGDKEPRISFLISGLLTFEEKNSSKGIMVKCNLCGKITNLENFNNHYTRCSSVDYLNQQSVRFFNKTIDKTKFFNMSEIDFNRYYFQMINYVKEHVSDAREYKLATNVLVTRDGKSIDYDSNLYKANEI